MAKRRSRKPYNFTAKRKNALKKAQLISARKRRILGKTGKGAGIAAASAVAGIGLTAVGAGVVFGIHANRNGQITRTPPQAKIPSAAWSKTQEQKVVSPGSKELVRIAGAISPADTPRDAPRALPLSRTYDQILADKNAGRYQRGCNCTSLTCSKHKTEMVTPGDKTNLTKITYAAANADQQRRLMSEQAKVQQSGLGRNSGGPGRTHAGGVRWGDGGSVDPQVRTMAEELGHSYSPLGSPTDDLRSHNIIEKSLPKNLLQGEQTNSLVDGTNAVSKGTMKRAISQHQNAKRAITEEVGLIDDTLLDMMIAEGEVIANSLGLRKRKKKK
jgi:hypothetical protein